MNRLDGKVAVVTGAASGLGLAFSRAFAAEGATVVMTDVSAEAGKKAASEIGSAASFIKLDVAQEDGWDALAEEVRSRHGWLDVLVNNAGVGLGGSVEDCTNEVWNITLAVNATGVFLGCRTMLPLLKKSKSGSIINISSIFGMVGDQATVAYSASKGAVRAMTKSAALHCATLNPPVRVNSVHPGFVMTPMVEKGAGALPPEMAEQYMARTVGLVPLGRIGEPDDLAGVVVFLASDEARYVTGAEYVVDGGFTAR
jgi:NAD(P)-dependent dehydrogenase (short-subunit alcohol dehydrogenase family)